MQERMKSLDLPEKLRNLSIMPSDDECMGVTTREDEEFP
jgi:hypothetical protein